MTLISALPAELLGETLQYLPIGPLLAFGETSKYHHALQVSVMSKLHLGVFPSRIECIMSSLDALAEAKDTDRVHIVLSKSESRSTYAIIRSQNSVTKALISKYEHTLRDLDVALWEVEEHTTKTIATARNLKHLSIRLDHPYTRHPRLDRTFWDSSPGSTVWNSLCTKHNEYGALGRLQSLSLARAGITDYQMQQLLESNPQIRTLCLQKCLNLTKEFFEDLTRSRVGRRLKKLHFTDNKSHGINDGILEHVGMLPCVKVSKILPQSRAKTDDRSIVVVLLRLP